MSYKYLLVGIGSGIFVIGLIIITIMIVNTNLESKEFGKQTNQTKNSLSTLKADKIEVFHFHATQQCWSCITVGEYALKIIKEKFPEEYANGKIVFKDINGDLSENRELVQKYQARGSSLFVNAIVDNKDNIEEDVVVWRLITNEKRFKEYFESKLNKLLGK